MRNPSNWQRVRVVANRRDCEHYAVSLRSGHLDCSNCSINDSKTINPKALIT